MQIAYVTETYPPEVNGVAITVARTVEYLLRQGWGVNLIRPSQRGEVPHQERPQTGPSSIQAASEWRTCGLPIPMYRDLRFGLASPSAMREHLALLRPDLVHVATPGPLGFVAARAARAAGIPLTMDFRTHFDTYTRYYGLGWLEDPVRRYLRSLHALAACTFVPSPALRDELMRLGFERIEVVGRGVDTEHYSPGRRSESLRAGWGAASDAPVLLYVGRLAAEKNVGCVLDTFMALRQRRPDARLVLVGDGPLRDWCKARCPQAHFTGVLHGDALAAHYASADVFLFPSMSETFGNVTLEAMASGLVVVAGDTAAAAMHIQHGSSGLLIPTADRAAFAAAFARAACEAAEQLPALVPLRMRAREAAERVQWGPVLARFEQRLRQHARAATTGRGHQVLVAGTGASP